MVSHYLNFLFLAEEKEYKASRMIFYHNTFEIIKFDIDRNLNCLFCKGEPVLPKPVDQSDNIEIGEAVTVGEKEGK